MIDIIHSLGYFHGEANFYNRNAESESKNLLLYHIVVFNENLKTPPKPYKEFLYEESKFTRSTQA